MKKARGILRRTLVMLLSVFLLNGVFPVDGLIRAAETDEPDTAYGGSNDQTSLAAAPAISYIGTDGKKLKEGTDYSIGVPDADDPYNTDTKGIVKVTITGKGAYRNDPIPVTFRYEEKTSDLSRAKTAKKIADQEYTGSPIKLSASELTGILTAKDTNGNTVDLVPGTDFRVTGYSSNVKKGTAKVTLQGTGNYAGTKTLTFKIVQKTVNYRGELVEGEWK